MKALEITKSIHGHLKRKDFSDNEIDKIISLMEFYNTHLHRDTVLDTVKKGDKASQIHTARESKSSLMSRIMIYVDDGNSKYHEEMRCVAAAYGYRFACGMEKV